MAEPDKRAHENSYFSDDVLAETVKNWKRPSNWFILLAAFILIFVCTSDTLLAKWMNRQQVQFEPDGPVEFFHGLIWQTLISYILEALLIFVFLYDQYKAKSAGKKFYYEAVQLHTRVESFSKSHCPFYYWALPSFLDVLTSLGVNYALTLIRGSTLQLLRNFNILIAAILSLILVRVALRVHQWIGTITVTIGLIAVAIGELNNPDENTNNSSLAWLGIIFAILGTVANAVQVVVEERLYRSYHASPYEAMGYFGIFGLIISFAAYGVAELAAWKEDRLSQVIYVLKQGTKESNLVLVSSILLMISIACFNLSGMIVTKLGSAVLRMILISMRTVTIWAGESILGLADLNTKSIPGLMITILGIFVYNYNYLSPPDWFKYDHILRQPWMIFSFLNNPDEIEAESIQIAEKVKTKKNLHEQEDFVSV